MLEIITIHGGSELRGKRPNIKFIDNSSLLTEKLNELEKTHHIVAIIDGTRWADCNDPRITVLARKR